MCSWQATEEYKEKKNMGCGQDQVYRDKAMKSLMEYLMEEQKLNMATL